jgi:hypothetical protein
MTGLLQQRHVYREFAARRFPRLAAGRLRVDNPRGRSTRVSGIGIRRRQTGRRLVSCLVAYAFALQMVLFAFAAPAAAGLTADEAALAASVCTHDKSAPFGPAQNSGGEEHCKFCPAGGHSIFAAPTPPHHAIVRAAEAAALPSTGALAPPSRAHASAQPRGPPLAA